MNDSLILIGIFHKGLVTNYGEGRLQNGRGHVKRGGGGKGFSHAERGGGGRTNNFWVVFMQKLKVLAIL